MPETTCFAQVRGRVIRATRLDAVGTPVVSTTSVVVSKRISSITIDEVTEDGTDVRERNFGDEMCVVDDSYTSVLGYSGDINLCGVDPDMISIFTGQPVRKNAAGDTVGFGAKTNIDLDGFGYALEVWTRLAGSPVDAQGRRLWGYTVFPFFKGGRLGGFSFENGLVQFTITGARTRDNNKWGVGPFDVDMSEGVSPFTAGPLFEAMDPFEAYRNIVVALAPPAATCGALALTA